MYYFKHQEKVLNAPRFLRDKFYYDGHIFEKELLSELAIYKKGKSLPINFFDAIKYVYEISIVDIALLLNVTVSVVYRAKKQSISSKRISEFSELLHMPSSMMMNTTTQDFEELKKSKINFLSKNDLEQQLRKVPTWRERDAQFTSEMLQCPIEKAIQFARIDKLCWIKGMPLDEFTAIEKTLIEFMCNNKLNLQSFEYSIGFGGRRQIRQHHKQ